jgi:hypothetical protein
MKAISVCGLFDIGKLLILTVSSEKEPKIYYKILNFIFIGNWINSFLRFDFITK